MIFHPCEITILIGLIMALGGVGGTVTIKFPPFIVVGGVGAVLLIMALVFGICAF